MRIAAPVLAAVVALAGCSAYQSHPSAADCQRQVRLGDRVYTSYGHTDRAATRFALADRAECHDVGRHADGSVFTENPTQVRVWSFDGYETEKVLGVRFERDSFAVFVADSVPRAESELIFTELRQSQR